MGRDGAGSYVTMKAIAVPITYCCSAAEHMLFPRETGEFTTSACPDLSFSHDDSPLEATRQAQTWGQPSFKGFTR